MHCNGDKVHDYHNVYISGGGSSSGSSAIGEGGIGEGGIGDVEGGGDIGGDIDDIGEGSDRNFVGYLLSNCCEGENIRQEERVDTEAVKKVPGECSRSSKYLL